MDRLNFPTSEIISTLPRNTSTQILNESLEILCGEKDAKISCSASMRSESTASTRNFPCHPSTQRPVDLAQMSSYDGIINHNNLLIDDENTAPDEKESNQDPLSCSVSAKTMSTSSVCIEPDRRPMGRPKKYAKKCNVVKESKQDLHSDSESISSESGISVRNSPDRRPVRRHAKRIFEKSLSSDSEVENRRTYHKRQPRKSSIKAEMIESSKRGNRESKNSCNIVGSVKEKDNDSNHRDDHRFPETLHAFVEEVSKKAPYILNWTYNGEAFVIKKVSPQGLPK
jgi:hypothetical protein